jgi:hypothetical protein
MLGAETRMQEASRELTPWARGARVSPSAAGYVTFKALAGTPGRLVAPDVAAAAEERGLDQARA